MKIEMVYRVTEEISKMKETLGQDIQDYLLQDYPSISPLFPHRAVPFLLS